MQDALGEAGEAGEPVDREGQDGGEHTAREQDRNTIQGDAGVDEGP